MLLAPARRTWLAILAVPLASAFLVAAEGLARATPQCPPGTHPSQGGFYVAGALSIMVTVALFGVGLKVTLGYKGSRRLVALVITILGTALCAFIGFWFTLITGLILSGCVTG
jgi:hypothetical protein